MAKHGDEAERADAPEPVVPDDDAQATKVIEPIDPDVQATEVIQPAVAPAAAAGDPSASADAAASATPVDPAEPADPAAPVDVAAPPRRRLSRAARIWITVGAVVIALVALVIVADVVARTIAEQRVAEEIEGNLPAGVEGDVDVAIGGASVILQYLSGTMEQVTLAAPELQVQGVPVDATVVAEGVPVDLASPVRDLHAVINIDEASLNRLVSIAGVDGGVTLGDGTVAYDDQIKVLGFDIDYSVTARPTAAGDTVLLEPVGVEVGAGGGSLDVSSLIERLLGDDPVEVCIADRLPEGVEVQSIAVAPGIARIDLAAQGLTLDAASLQQTGSCG